MNKNSSCARKAAPHAGRKAQERDAHRLAMLGAAERVFARKGFIEATLGEIAREADFAVGTFYNFFESKEDLYAHVLDSIVRGFMAEFDKDVRKRDHPEDALSALVDLRLRIFGQHREFFRIFFEQPAGGVNLTRKHLEFREHYRSEVCGLFASGIRRGVFDPVDPLYAALCLDGMLNAIFRYWSSHNNGAPPPKEIQKVKRILLDRFRRQRPLE